MVKVTTRGHYGVRAMVELARAYGSGPLPLAEIASHEALPLGYLEQLIANLRRAGLVQATRGAHGGYELSREPSQVTVGEVVRALDGPIDLMECASEQFAPGSCLREGACASKLVWQRVRQSVAAVLDSTTLADLCKSPFTEPYVTAPSGGKDG